MSKGLAIFLSLACAPLSLAQKPPTAASTQESINQALALLQQHHELLMGLSIDVRSFHTNFSASSGKTLNDEQVLQLAPLLRFFVFHYREFLTTREVFLDQLIEDLSSPKKYHKHFAQLVTSLPELQQALYHFYSTREKILRDSLFQVAQKESSLLYTAAMLGAASETKSQLEKLSNEDISLSIGKKIEQFIKKNEKETPGSIYSKKVARFVDFINYDSKSLVLITRSFLPSLELLKILKSAEGHSRALGASKEMSPSEKQEHQSMRMILLSHDLVDEGRRQLLTNRSLPRDAPKQYSEYRRALLRLELDVIMTKDTPPKGMSLLRDYVWINDKFVLGDRN